MFLKNNFELYIDFHRRVKEYRLKKEKEERRKKNIMAFGLIISIAAASLGFLYLKNKRLGFWYIILALHNIIQKILHFY